MSRFAVETYEGKDGKTYNVPNYIASDRYYEKNVIIKDAVIEDFTSRGYNVSWKILAADDYGVPQHRRRVFFVGLNKKIFDDISSIDDAQIGDIVLFVNKIKNRPSHCGIYLGNNQVIHCSGFVHISRIDNIGIRDEYMEKDPFCFIYKILRPKQKDNLLFNF